MARGAELCNLADSAGIVYRRLFFFVEEEKTQEERELSEEQQSSEEQEEEEEGEEGVEKDVQSRKAGAINLYNFVIAFAKTTKPSTTLQQANNIIQKSQPERSLVGNYLFLHLVTMHTVYIYCY